MFQYIQRALGRFDHPVLVSLYLGGGLLGLLGFVLDVLGVQPLLASFCAVYAIFFATLASIGYGILLAARLISEVLDRQAPHT